MSLEEKIYKQLEYHQEKEQILSHLHFSEDGVCSDLLPGGIPKMIRQGDFWKVILSYDDMRGPQGIFEYEEEGTAIARLIGAVEGGLQKQVGTSRGFGGPGSENMPRSDRNKTDRLDPDRKAAAGPETVSAWILIGLGMFWWACSLGFMAMKMFVPGGFGSGLSVMVILCGIQAYRKAKGTWMGLAAGICRILAFAAGFLTFVFLVGAVCGSRELILPLIVFFLLTGVFIVAGKRLKKKRKPELQEKEVLESSPEEIGGSEKKEIRPFEQDTGKNPKTKTGSYNTLPEGYEEIRSLFEQTRFYGGHEYTIEKVSLVCDAEENRFIHIYRNENAQEANGRACETEREYLVKVEEEDHVNEDNWRRFMLLRPNLVLKESFSMRVDQEALAYAIKKSAAVSKDSV